eukprot:CAMPEP_0115349038 /NCGR_PEP_ID=MMETSP0270-20121206/95712_1 /TAXON_ID=71861 /ORGANISM="Scrippsiella trochoidea, Strain CCMP3099" /LENGTH=115 /DNA_ID=CAMNT_0002771023 /DNA_START=468 /DNA_END=812 /DNA_ORIENTATION=-
MQLVKVKRLPLVRSGDLAPLLVQDVVDAALAVQEDREDVLQADASLPLGCSEAARRAHVVVSEVGVHTRTLERVGLDMVADDITSVAVVSKVLLRHVVRELALVEEGLAVLPVPD